MFLFQLPEPTGSDSENVFSKSLNYLVDSLIQNFAPSFPLKQVAIIDKNILRICIYEIKFNELNPSIAMDEAIEIAKIFGSDKSGAFINGVIDSFVQNDKI